jgi:hypothetical protein
MCNPGQPASPAALAGADPLAPADALAAVATGLTALAALDMATLTTQEQAEVLRVLSRAEAQVLAARSAALAAFDSSAGFESDGMAGSRSWLRWQTRVTTSAAAGAVGWMRRLRAHPEVAATLGAGQISPSWARPVCDWTEGLGDDDRDAADRILLAAAARGAQLADLAGLAEEIRARCARPDTDDPDDGFRDRSLRLSSYFHGNGQLTGNLTPECTAALRAVLDALAVKAGPEDIRSQDQRDHDALQEALQRLLAARCLPERGGQPAMIQLHMSLDQLLGLDGAAAATAEWAGHGATAPPGADCDASIVPVVTGHIDQELLDQLATDLLRPETDPDAAVVPSGAPVAEPSGSPGGQAPPQATTAPDPGTAARELILTRATRLLAGPSGLAAWLRTHLTTGPAATMSQPLDVGLPTEVIPTHLRRAVVLRDRRCAFPGCERAPAGCHVHHVVPRSEGGITSLANCVLLCPFHHLIAIHRWGWRLRLDPDGTTTVTSPDGSRMYRSHAPPTAA